MRRVARLLTRKANEIIFAAEVLVLITVLTVYGCLGQAADPFGDPVLGPHTAADTELLLGAIHSDWPRQQQAILAGANPNITDKSGDPFLNWHLRTDQDVDHLRFLVQHGANVNVRDAKFGITPLVVATVPATISYLVSVAALEAKDNEGLTPLFHVLKQWSFLSSGLSESTVNSDVTTLLGRGANPNAVDQQGENALFYFIRMGHEYSKSCIGCRTVDPSTIIRALAQAGVSLNQRAQITGYAAPVSVLGYLGGQSKPANEGHFKTGQRE